MVAPAPPKKKAAPRKERVKRGSREPRHFPMRPAAVLASQTRIPTIEERLAKANERLRNVDPDFRAEYERRFDMSWVYHDSALEGVVYTEEELAAAFGLAPVASEEASAIALVAEIRRHRAALDFIRDETMKETITVDFIRKLHHMLRPVEGGPAEVKYRKDIPQHRLYFHEYAAPEKIPAKVQAVVDFLNSGENPKSKALIRFASRAHYDLLRAFPFSDDSGKVARLLLNLLLVRGGLPPAIFHMSERQRYYEALKGSSSTMNTITMDAIDNNLKSIEKLLDTYDARRGLRTL
jgi:Fic family protein